MEDEAVGMLKRVLTAWGDYETAAADPDVDRQIVGSLRSDFDDMMFKVYQWIEKYDASQKESNND